jgi:hypothetical protein
MDKEDFLDLLQIALLYFDGADLNNYSADPELMKMGKNLANSAKDSKFSTTYRITQNDLKKIGK